MNQQPAIFMNNEKQIREAAEKDIPEMMRIRIAVKENRLSNPFRITAADYKEYIHEKGKSWVCEISEQITGFAVIDLTGKNIWALFVDPEFEHRGVGRLLHDSMLDWYFKNHNGTLWLSTSPETRAEKFYRQSGWRETGIYGAGEIKFEMSCTEWRLQKTPSTSG